MFKTKYFELKNNCAHKQKVELQTLITKIDTFFNKKIKTNKELIKEFKKILEPKLEKFVVDAKMFKIQRYKIWKNGSAAEEILTNKFLDQKINYIHQNPVTAGIVVEDFNYLYSSASDYSGEKGLVEVFVV